MYHIVLENYQIFYNSLIFNDIKWIKKFKNYLWGLGLPIMDSIMAVKKLTNNPKMKAVNQPCMWNPGTISATM